MEFYNKIVFVLFVFVVFFSARAMGADEGVNEENSNVSEKKEVVALKNNLFYDAMATPNLELEVLLDPKWTMEFGVGFNPFPLNDEKYPKWRHLVVSVAPRYWFCHPFNRGFFSFNAAYAHYNVAGDAYPVAYMYKQVRENRYQGDAVMAGVSFGWHFPISPHFSIELEGGADAGYTWYEEFECVHCGKKKDEGGSWFVLPKIAVNVAVPLGGDEASMAKRCDCEKLTQKPEIEQVTRGFVPIEPLTVDIAKPVAAVTPFVPTFTVRSDRMNRLRNRLLRDAEEYEPYDINTPLSADPRNVFIFFDVDVTKMDRSFIENDKLMDSIIYILGEAMADTTIRISKIQIVGFASFDASVAYNTRLAGSRAETIKEYMQSLYQIDDSVFAVCNGGESWAELRYQLEKVEFLGKADVLRIIDTEPDLDTRERLIKKLNKGATYRYMRDELKRILRNLGCITVYCENTN